MRRVWQAVGVVAGYWCLLVTVTSVGMAVWAWRSPGAVEAGGTSPWVVLPPQAVVSFAVARWAWRRGTAAPAAGPG